MKAKINRIKQKGIALVSVLMILVALMALTMGFAHFTIQDWITGKSYHQANICFYLAQAGLEYARFLVKHNMLIYPYAPFDDSARDILTDEYNFTIIDQAEKGSFTAGNNTNDYDENNDGIIDATFGDPNMGYKNLPMTPGGMQPRSLIDIYDNGMEFILINRLAVGSDILVQEILEKGNATGSFRIRVIEDNDPNAASDTKRILLVRSEGFIRSVPNEVWNDDPSTWELAGFPIISRRTLIMRIPYTITISDSATIPMPQNYQLLSDGWWERFR